MLDLPIELISRIFGEIEKTGGFNQAVMPANRALLPYYLRVLYHAIILSMEKLHHLMSCVGKNLDLLKLIKVLTIIEGDYERSSYSKIKKLFSHATEVIHLSLTSDGEEYLYSIEILLDPSNSQNFPHLESFFIHNPEEDGTLSRNEDVGSIGVFLRSHPSVETFEVALDRITTESAVLSSDFDNIRAVTLVGNGGILGNLGLLSRFNHLEDLTFDVFENPELVTSSHTQALSTITPSSKKLMNKLRLGDVIDSFIDSSDPLILPQPDLNDIGTLLPSFSSLQSLQIDFKIIKEDLLYRVIIKDLPSLYELILEEGLRPTTKELETFAEALRNSKRKFTIQLAPFKNTGVMGKSFETDNLLWMDCNRRATAGKTGTKWSIKMNKKWKRPTWTTEMTFTNARRWKRICKGSGLEILPRDIFRAVEIAAAFQKELKFCSELEVHLNELAGPSLVKKAVKDSQASIKGKEKETKVSNDRKPEKILLEEETFRIGWIGAPHDTRKISKTDSVTIPNSVTIYSSLVGWKLPNWSKSKFEEMTRLVSLAEFRGQAIPPTLKKALRIESKHREELEKLRKQVQVENLGLVVKISTSVVDGVWFRRAKQVVLPPPSIEVIPPPAPEVGILELVPAVMTASTSALTSISASSSREKPRWRY